MLHKSFLGLLLAPFLVLLAGCCANNPCDCNDSLADSLFFAFDSSFTKTELDTVYVSRYSKTNLNQAPEVLPLPDTTRRPTTLAAQINFNKQNTKGLVVISNNAPFSQSSSTTNLSGYNYVLRLQKDGSRTDYYTYIIDKISLTGRYVADGCCTCYRNSQKFVRVRVPVTAKDTTTVFSGYVTDADNNSYPRIPVVIQLTK